MKKTETFENWLSRWYIPEIAPPPGRRVPPKEYGIQTFIQDSLNRFRPLLGSNRQQWAEYLERVLRKEPAADREAVLRAWSTCWWFYDRMVLQRKPGLRGCRITADDEAWMELTGYVDWMRAREVNND